jgi:hypothetical protein
LIKKKYRERKISRRYVPLRMSLTSYYHGLSTYRPIRPIQSSYAKWLDHPKIEDLKIYSTSTSMYIVQYNKGSRFLSFLAFKYLTTELDMQNNSKIKVVQTFFFIFMSSYNCRNKFLMEAPKK